MFTNKNETSIDISPELRKQISSEEQKMLNFLNKVATQSKSVERNNSIIVTETDFVAHMNDGQKLLIDGQTSENFSRYGDLRLDIVSFGTFKNHWKDIPAVNKHSRERTVNGTAQTLKEHLDYYVSRIKPGKILAGPQMESYCNYVLYAIYNGRIVDSDKPDKILLLNARKAEEFVEKNWRNYNKCQPVKFNDKARNSIKESYASAFIPVSVNILKKENIVKEHWTSSDISNYYQL